MAILDAVISATIEVTIRNVFARIDTAVPLFQKSSIAQKHFIFKEAMGGSEEWSLGSEVLREEVGRIFVPGGRAKKPGFPLQVLGFACAKPAGFPLQSLAPHGLILASSCRQCENASFFLKNIQKNIRNCNILCIVVRES
jgi:hypothetical protein